MQAAVDQLIQFYVLAGTPWGIIHGVSNKYRDFLLTESSWRGIMTASIEEHAAKVADKLPSVLVAANLTEGYDGKDDLCRFVILPKVPFPSLGDTRTRLRMEEDARSFDYQALVAVVQGAGRGVRHPDDYADTWILDELWSMLYSKRKTWLPQSFKESYHHKVQLPGG
jgi:Rad3-related DNA helicase